MGDANDMSDLTNATAVHCTVAYFISNCRHQGIPDNEIHAAIQSEGITLSWDDCAIIDRILYAPDCQPGGYWRSAYQYPTCGDIVDVPVLAHNEYTRRHRITKCYFFTFDTIPAHCGQVGSAT